MRTTQSEDGLQLLVFSLLGMALLASVALAPSHQRQTSIFKSRNQPYLRYDYLHELVSDAR